MVRLQLSSVVAHMWPLVTSLRLRARARDAKCVVLAPGTQSYPHVGLILSFHFILPPNCFVFVTTSTEYKGKEHNIII